MFMSVSGVLEEEWNDILSSTTFFQETNNNEKLIAESFNQCVNL